ncbi:MAG: fibronectin type III domain-containing protein [Lachnospiraceae bacterium]|nr:fibronectin type III domain-containing protein [Lachnospiraceae bacterium]
MKKRFARLSALLLSAALTLTLIPANFAYAKEADNSNAQVQSSEVQENASDEITLSDADKDEQKAQQTETKETAEADTNNEATAEKVTIASVPVVYADGNIVEDGVTLDFANSEDSGNDTIAYKVKDGCLSNVKLTPGVQYKVSISWEDDDYWQAHEMAYAKDQYVRVGVRAKSKCLYFYNTNKNEVSDKPIRQLTIKEYDAKDPEKITIPSVQVTYADGTPVEDGHLFTFDNTDDAENDSHDYAVKDGHISNVKLEPGIPYKVSISWNDPDPDYSLDHTLAFAQNGFVRVAAKPNAKTLLHFDTESDTITKTAVRKLTVKKADADDPVKVPYNKDVNVADIDVVYEDGTPVEDGMVFDVINMQTLLDSSNYSTTYTTKNGKLSGIKMKSEVPYKIGFDVTNKYWRTHNIVGAYESDKLMRLYARYDNQAPLYYDYDEGIDADENVCRKLVVKKLDKEQDNECVIPASCWMSVLLSDNGYYAEGGLSFKMTRLDTNKSKTVLSREGELVVMGKSYTDYLLTLDKNDTYVIDYETNPVFKPYKELGGIPFSFQQDSAGKTQAVLKGYDVEDFRGRLNYTFVDLKRIDGKQNTTGKKFSDVDCGESSDIKTLYAADKVTLKNMAVTEVKSGSDKAEPLNKDITFAFYNCSTQTVETTAKSHNGILEDVELIKDHRYIVYAQDSEYEMPNHYIKLAKTGEKPLCYKCNKTENSFELTKRETALANPADAGRVNVVLPVSYINAEGEKSLVPNVKVKLVSPFDTVEGTTNADGNLEVSLMEDYNYMVLIDSDKYAIESFPLTVKDKSEYGAGKYTFNHFSCGSVGGLLLLDKGTEHDRDVTLTGTSKDTTVTGLNFGQGSYILHDRVLEDYKVAALEGKDYQVLDIDALNMYRTEISKLAAGDFKITRKLPEGKSVKNVYYIDKDNKLQKLDFTEKDGSVTFKMGSLSMYNNVIEFGTSDEPEKPSKPEKPDQPEKPSKVTVVKASQVSLNKTSYTYSGKAVKPAVKVVVKGKKLKAGIDYKVTYSSNKNVGKAKAIVTFKDKYVGKITKTFLIKPKATTLKSVTSAKKAFKATWKKQSKQTTGYRIDYSTNKNFNSKVKTVYVSKTNITSKTVKNLKKNQKYYVRIRTYKKAGKTFYHSSWSNVKSVKVK